MSFWNNPGASFEGLAHDPWHSMENFATTGLVPLIPYVAGIVGGIYGGPAGAAAGGAAGQEGVDYFSGNSKARTGQGIFGSLVGGAGKGMMASGGYGAGMNYMDTGSISSGQGMSALSQLTKLFGNSASGSAGGSSIGGTSSSSSPLNYFQARNQKIQDLQRYITGEPPLTGIGNQAAVSQDAEKQALEGYSTDKNKPEYVADSKPVEVFNDETNEG